MKPQVPFVLEHSGWPALLVEEGGTIRRANSAAVDAFGPGVAGGSTLLASIWAAENPGKPEMFLANFEVTGHNHATVKLRNKSGLPEDFSIFICPINRDEQKYFLLQLFPLSAAAPPAVGEPFVLKETSARARSEPVAPAVDASVAHKQKLDCALQLTRTVALDFNNALTSILGHTSLLLSKTELGHPFRSSLVEVEKSAAKAAEIANDLAAFSRQEKDTPVQTAGNLNLVLQRAVDLFRKPEFPGIEWSLPLERKLFSANFDEAKMQQAFVKVLENSLQSMPAGGRITVQTRNLTATEPIQDRTARLGAGNYVVVEITDTGSGIDPEILPRVFEPFFTTKKGPAHRGLGLAWLYGIVTNHGGAVTVGSELKTGTSVRIYLPAQTRIVKDTTVEVGDLGGSETVLIVDDEDLLLTMAQMVLSTYGYEVLTANSGQKAMDIIFQAKKPIDLVITDLVMPNMSGRELIEHLRQVSPKTRIICSSGYVRAASAEENDAYLQKPFTSQDLLRKVKQVLAPSVA